MRVRYTLRAQADLDAIYAYLDLCQSAAALSVKELLERRIGNLADFPFIAPVTDEPGVRELTVVRYPYQIYYQVLGNELRILHIRHTARRPWSGADE